jgi:hypothetical protein
MRRPPVADEAAVPAMPRRKAVGAPAFGEGID